MSTGGRPPDLANRRAVLDATRDVLADVGYSALTIDGVAKRAGLYRLLIYRTWESKPALVVDALFGDIPGFRTDDTGALASDMRAFVHAHAAIITRPAHLQGLPGLTTELRADRMLYKTVYTTYVVPVEEALGRVLARAEQRGDLPAPVNAAHLNACITGMIQILAVSSDLDGEDLVDEVTRMCLSGAFDRD